MMHDWPRRRVPPPPRYPRVLGVLLTLLVLALWLALYVIEVSHRITPAALLLATIVGAPVLVWQFRAYFHRRLP